MSITIRQITLWPLAIPMRRRFKHATAERSVATPTILQVELADGTLGYGETHARTYVTGETPEGLAQTYRDVFMLDLVEFRPDSFPAALEEIAKLPERDYDGRRVTAARAALELALLDAYSRAFKRPLEMLASWLGDPGLGTPGSLGSVRYSGVVSAESPDAVRRSIRKMRWFGLRDFKIKVGDADDSERLAAAVKALGRSLTAGRTTLRADANGGWSLEQARERLAAWRDLPISAIEQPLTPASDLELAALSNETSIPFMADESLVTSDDATRLVADRGFGLFNVRLAKNGGLIPSMRIARVAQRAGLGVQLGCLVGETSLLSAAGRWFLKMTPNVRFAEGSYGRFLLRDDIVKRRVQFGFGGRGKPMTGFGLGVEVDPESLRRLCSDRPVTLSL